ncbi:unnamed protein product [Prunus brigantina]
METSVILVCYNGKWVTSKKVCKYEGGDSKGLIVPRTIKFTELLDRVHKIGNTNSREDKVCLKFSVLVASNEWKHIKIEDDDDVNFFMKYNSEVTPSKLAPLLVSIEDKGLTNDVVDSMHITTNSSRMGRSSVAIVESNEVTWNNTNDTDVGSEVGTDFMDMIDFSEVEDMHGGDNGTKRNEVSVYSAPPILGCLNTSAQLPIMHLGGESEPIREHYWNQIGEQNRYNEAGVNDGEAYVDSGSNAFDGNRNIYPHAFGIGDLERDASWHWFFTKLHEAIGECPNLVIISDRNVSIQNVWNKVFPTAQHGICFYHMKGNMKRTCKLKKRDPILMHFEQAAKSYSIAEFDCHFRKIKRKEHVAQYLEEAGLHKWSRAHMDGRRYNVMTTNIAESINSVLRFTRTLPVVHLIGEIMNPLVKWFTERRELTLNCTTTLCPNFGEKKLRNRLEDAARMNVVKVNNA